MKAANESDNDRMIEISTILESFNSRLKASMAFVPRHQSTLLQSSMTVVDERTAARCICMRNISMPKREVLGRRG